MPSDEEIEQFEIDAILRHRDRHGVREYYVHWLGYPDEDNNWVAEDDMACPELMCSYLSKYNERKERERLRKSKTPGRDRSTTPSTSSKSSKRWIEPAAPAPKKHKREKSSLSASPASSSHRSTTPSSKERQGTPQQCYRTTTSPLPLPSSRGGSSVPNDPPSDRKLSPQRYKVAPTAANDEPVVNASNLWNTIADMAVMQVTSPAVDKKKHKKRHRMSEAPTAGKSEASRGKLDSSEPSSTVRDKIFEKQKDHVATAKEPATVTSQVTAEKPNEEAGLVIASHFAINLVDEESPVPQPQDGLPVASGVSDSVVAVDKETATVATAVPVTEKRNSAVVRTDSVSDTGVVSESVRRRMEQKSTWARKVAPRKSVAMDHDDPHPSTSVGVLCPSPSSPSDRADLNGQDDVFNPTICQGEESGEEEVEQDDDDLTDYEDIYGDGDESTVPRRANTSLNPYERGLKAQKIVHFTRFRGKYYATIKFQGHDVLENLEYSMIRRLDPVLLANYFVRIHKRCLARGIDEGHPGGFVEMFSDEESDDEF